MKVKNSRIKLWAHLVSQHGTILDLDLTMVDMMLTSKIDGWVKVR